MKVYLRSLDDQTQFVIEEGENLLLGRLDQCDFMVNDGSVSSQHARLHLSEGVLVLADLDSTNGTRVNYTVLVAPMALMDGDTVEFGTVSFIVDGPGLRTERETVTDSAFINEFKPLDLSGPMDATMQLKAFTDEDLLEPHLASQASVQTDLEAVESEETHLGPSTEVQDDSFDPLHDEVHDEVDDEVDDEVHDEVDTVCSPVGRILVTSLFLLAFMGLMGGYLWQYVPIP